MGSRSIIGELTDAEIDRSRNRTDSGTLRDALAAAGLASRPRMQLESGRHKGYLELHIEQGRQLESRNLRAGIVAIGQYRIVITGQQDHAGAATMAERRDIGLARIALVPGAPSIIPGAAEILFQVRDIYMDTLQGMEDCLRRLVQESNPMERCTAVLSTDNRSLAAISDPGLMAALEISAQEVVPDARQRMPSGAGRDAQIIACRMPAAMLFTPSIYVISHHWTEDTKPEDLVAAAASSPGLPRASCNNPDAAKSTLRRRGEGGRPGYVSRVTRVFFASR
ncbi:N-carbamoyl-L-amino-acid hydrolase [Bradyrhizobium sp. Ghvi]|uniref:M20/M25/M40 family metallo-hydrolase n=1 Tax=Bradyrhizobium sp. Ghvi TaxID=1855319 RepID=UPI0008E8BE8D|nr:M20/M25/M40 family metallo-hydrolase [Bradyrhizobium sp. Ghvi]SFQ35883.1 N-carbamoyl-L-amino-acid hydrolase [Bradyrhizobium sp. Ghvi]